MNNLYWPVDGQTKEVEQHALEATFRGGIFHFPCNAIRVEPLPIKPGFAVIALDDLSGTEYIEDHRGKTIYGITDCTHSETVTELGPVKDGFTEQAPQTRFDEWDPVLQAWVTNETNQYQHQVAVVTDQRRAAYSRISDPLYMEAHRLKRQGLDIEAEEYALQADAAVQKIKADYPWPVAPTV